MRIREVIVQVGDVDEGVRFYTDVCGFTLRRTFDAGGVRIAELEAAGQRVTLVPARAPGVHLALATADVEAEQRRLGRYDVNRSEHIAEVAGGSWLAFTDPWGNRLGYWQDADPS